MSDRRTTAPQQETGVAVLVKQTGKTTTGIPAELNVTVDRDGEDGSALWMTHDKVLFIRDPEKLAQVVQALEAALAEAKQQHSLATVDLTTWGPAPEEDVPTGDAPAERTTLYPGMERNTGNIARFYGAIDDLRPKYLQDPLDLTKCAPDVPADVKECYIALRAAVRRWFISRGETATGAK